MIVPVRTQKKTLSLTLALNRNATHAVLDVVGKVLLKVPLQQRFSAS